MRALKIAATGMAAQQMRVETISNNLSNMSTTGYNARRAEFSDLHYQQMQRPGTVNAADGTVLPTGVQLGLGVSIRKNPSPSIARSSGPPVWVNVPCNIDVLRTVAPAIEIEGPPSIAATCSENTMPSCRKPVVAALAMLLATTRISRISPD